MFPFFTQGTVSSEVMQLVQGHTANELEAGIQDWRSLILGPRMWLL